MWVSEKTVKRHHELFRLTYLLTHFTAEVARLQHLLVCELHAAAQPQLAQLAARGCGVEGATLGDELAVLQVEPLQPRAAGAELEQQRVVQLSRRGSGQVGTVMTCQRQE